MEGLRLEWQLWAPQIRNQGQLISVYFGGGTPALLGPERIASILQWMDDAIGLDPSIEITLEANPENISLELMKAYKKVGINRASIGIQSMDDNLLITLGRTHSGAKGLEAVEATAEAGISNISIDLMYDLPDQNLCKWDRTLDAVSKLPLSHLSLYNLTIEPHTVYFKNREKLTPRIPNEETSLEMYERAILAIERAGLRQYEISAFAKPNFQSKHNSGYWTGRPFIGLGPSAFSYWDNKRFKNVSNLNAYSKQLKNGLFPIDFEEELDPNARLRELLAINLRLLEGVDLETIGPLPLETIKVLQDLERKAFIKKEGARISLTKKGILFYDTVATELI